MVLYSTMLDIDDSLTKEKFVQLVIKWNKESLYEENVIPGLEWDGKIMNKRYGSDECWLEIEEYRNGNTVAVRYEKVEDKGNRRKPLAGKYQLGKGKDGGDSVCHHKGRRIR